MVLDEHVSGLGIGVGGRRGNTGVHVDPERKVVTPEDGHLDVQSVVEDENAGRPLRLPVV